MSSADSSPVRVADADIFTVSTAMNFFSWLICEHPRMWSALGRAESSILADQLTDIDIRQPVWVTGLARSGSTLLLEILAGVPGVVSQTYKDFPPVFTPYAWNSMLRHMKPGDAAPAERVHRDGIQVTHDSPEAMEEPLWMAHFADLHNPAVSQLLPPGSNAEFAAFLRNHIRKLLAVRDGSRYLAKANYQVTRLDYLLHEFADARFVVPVRDPAGHIASLMKQHELFGRGQAANERARRHLRRVGHFEFGLDRAPVNTGDTAATREILELWDAGEEVRGWALYWSQIYAHVAERASASPALAAATCVIDYQRLCEEPQQQLARVFRHCGYEPGDAYLRTQAERIAAPTYYRPSFSDAELATIEELTRETYTRVTSLAG